MTTKQYLQSIEDLDRRIQSKLMDKTQLENMAMSITVPPDNEKVQSSGSQDRMANTVAKLIDLEREIDALVDSFIDRRKKIIAQIDSLDDSLYVQVLSLRYVCKLNLSDVAVKITGSSSSRRNIDRIHGRALQEFERLYGSEYKNSEKGV